MNKNKKRTGLALLLGALAFGFSAYTIPKSNNGFWRYYKVGMQYSDPIDPRGYKYYSADMCESGGGLCSTIWYTGATVEPIDGTDLDLSAIIKPHTLIDGHFAY